MGLAATCLFKNCQSYFARSSEVVYDDGMERQIRVKNKTYTIKLNAASVKAERAVFIENAVKGAVELAQTCAERLSDGGVDTEFAAVFGESDAVAKRCVRDVFCAVLEVFEGVGFLLKKVFVDKNGRSPEVLASADAAANTISLYDAFFAEDSDPENYRPSVLLHEAAHLCGLKSDAESGSPDSAECVRNFALLVSGKMDIDELLGKGESGEADVDEAEEDTSSDTDGAGESGVADGDGGESESDEDEQENGGESERGGEEMPYRPDQLRAPKGQSNGGQWVSEGGGSGGAGSSGGASISQQSHKTQTTNAPEKQPDSTSTESTEEKENKDEKPTNSKKTKEEEEEEKKPKKRKALSDTEAKKIIGDALDLLNCLSDGKIKFNSEEAKDLLFKTAINETDLIPRPQDKNKKTGKQGDATGLFQMEKATFYDMRDRVLKKRFSELYENLLKWFNPPNGEFEHDFLLKNDTFAAIMTRIRFYESAVPKGSKKKEVLPKVGDTRAQGLYWIYHYHKNKKNLRKKLESFIDKIKKHIKNSKK